MHIDQVSISEVLASDLIRDQFPQFEGEEIADLRSAGTVNAIFRIGSAHAARFPLRRIDPPTCLGLLEAEVRALKELATACPFPVPGPIAIGEPGGGYPMPWLVQTWIEGTPATPSGLSTSSVFARDLSDLVASLRKADLNGRRFDGQGRGGKLTDHDAWMETCFTNSEDLLDVERLRRLWSEFRELPAPGLEVMSHRDLIPANLLVQGDRLVGVLDGGAFGPADPALDLVAGWHLLDRERRGLFFDALEVGSLERSRSAAWAFVQAMGLVWYYQTSNPTMSALGQSTLARLLEISGT
ncbi:aminoglycoside phosphotransferase family protein [Roseibium sediminicola]|uniref:Aminoglycoside phosphotransferase family protein n=1 Tax=Roseibium sediminicola TaxID=2933272 RepID=A0ABT0GX62_9HYPH|nr:aminoglycoside phosphotransferase family protein [Roseibium sp. CAU 1639]MCK7614034.1 aminoglycoside phosphotransferase family protein [Roseibium sp. CAU 1639]